MIIKEIQKLIRLNKMMVKKITINGENAGNIENVIDVIIIWDINENA